MVGILSTFFQTIVGSGPWENGCLCLEESTRWYMWYLLHGRGDYDQLVDKPG
jgi:hypothetical protein